MVVLYLQDLVGAISRGKRLSLLFGRPCLRKTMPSHARRNRPPKPSLGERQLSTLFASKAAVLLSAN